MKVCLPGRLQARVLKVVIRERSTAGRFRVLSLPPASRPPVESQNTNIRGVPICEVRQRAEAGRASASRLAVALLGSAFPRSITSFDDHVGAHQR